MKRMILNIKDKEKVASMYNSGMSQAQVGEVFGVAHTTICHFMKKHNIKARQGRPAFNCDKCKVVSMHESGMTQEKIGKTLGVSRNRIQYFMKKHNIKTQKRGNSLKKIGN